MSRFLSTQEIDHVFRIFEEKNPHPQTELFWTNPYTLLVAVVLSAQATDKGVNKATQPLFPKVDSPQAMIAFGEENLRQAIKTISFFNTKAKNILKLSQMLVDQYQGSVPATREALEKLPGVGRKTANVVLGVAFHEPTLAVDTHIFRVSHRLGLSAGKTPRLVEEDLLRVIPPRFHRNAHHWLILHGRYVCKARRPLCYECPVREICPYEPKTT